MRGDDMDLNVFLAWYKFIVFMFYALTKTYASVTNSHLMVESYFRPDFVCFIL